MQPPHPDFGLYLVTDEAACQGRALLDIVEAAVRHGVTAVQLREKQLPTRAFVEKAVALRQVLQAYQVPLIINDRLDVALAADAEGLHVGQSDLPIATIRRFWPPHKIIGLSLDAPEQLAEAEAAQPHYLGVSPVFSTPTKTDTAPAWGLQGLQTLRKSTRLPLVAIGGIGLHNAAEVLHHGADGLAVVSAICSAAQPAQATAQLRQVLDAHRQRL